MSRLVGGSGKVCAVVVAKHYPVLLFSLGYRVLLERYSCFYRYFYFFRALEGWEEFLEVRDMVEVFGGRGSYWLWLWRRCCRAGRVCLLHYELPSEGYFVRALFLAWLLWREVEVVFPLGEGWVCRRIGPYRWGVLCTWFGVLGRRYLVPLRWWEGLCDLFWLIGYWVLFFILCLRRWRGG